MAATLIICMFPLIGNILIWWPHHVPYMGTVWMQPSTCSHLEHFGCNPQHVPIWNTLDATLNMFPLLIHGNTLDATLNTFPLLIYGNALDATLIMFPLLNNKNILDATLIMFLLVIHGNALDATLIMFLLLIHGRDRSMIDAALPRKNCRCVKISLLPAHGHTHPPDHISAYPRVSANNTAAQCEAQCYCCCLCNDVGIEHGV